MPMACLTLDKPERLVIMAATAAAQDLTLEVVGFDSIGAPRRYVWADEDVYGEDFDSQDPRVDLRLPAGTTSSPSASTGARRRRTTSR